MRRVTHLLAGAALAGGVGLLGAPAAHADTTCDAYSGVCPVVPGKQLPAGEVKAVVVKKPAATPSTLPFTGGDVVLVSVLGAAAVAGGGALLVAGRRRGAETA